MARDLPPLNALRFFEAAARHLSFTRAAEELHVTQAAISHQMKALETHLGVRLFRRLPRRLLLTEEGQRLLPVVHDAFDRIAHTARRLAKEGESGPLIVMLRPYFAARWLSPRLSQFWERHPDIDLRLHHSIDPVVDFERERVDMAVRWGRGEWPGVEVELLLPVRVTPVCSPKLLRGPHPLRRPADLRHHTLLHEESYDLWAKWLAAAGVHDLEARGPIIDDTNVRTQAAIDGQGVTFGALSLLADDLATGRLVAPFPLTLDDLAYYIVYPPGALARPKVKVFRDWLLEEAARHRAADTPLTSRPATPSPPEQGRQLLPGPGLE